MAITNTHSYEGSRFDNIFVFSIICIYIYIYIYTYIYIYIELRMPIYINMHTCLYSESVCKSRPEADRSEGSDIKYMGNIGNIINYYKD